MKKKVLISWLAIGVLAIVYSAIWMQAANKFEQHLICLSNEFKEHHGDIKYDHFKVKGFPFKLVANLKNLTILKNKAGSISIKVNSDIVAQTSVFNLSNVNFSTQGTTHLSLFLNDTSSSSLLTAQQIEGNIDLQRQGLNCIASLILKNVNLALGEMKTAAENIRVENFQTQLPTHSKIQLTAVNITSGLNDQIPFGQKIDHLKLRVRFDSEQPTETLSSHHLLEALARQGGTFEVEEATIESGKLSVQGNGTLTLDTAKQPLAAMNLKIQGLDVVLAHLVQLKQIDPYVVGFAQTALSPFKVASSQAEEPLVYNIPISLQEGQLSVASFPLVKIPPIDWTSLLSVKSSHSKTVP